MLRWDFHWHCWDCWDKSTFVKTFQDFTGLFEIYRDISTLSRLFEGLQAQKSQQIEKSWSGWMIKSTYSWSRSRQTVKIYQNFRSQQISQSLSRLFGLEGGVETKSRFIDLEWDFSIVKLFEIIKILSTVETYFLPVSRSRVSIKTRLRQIKTPMLNFFSLCIE
jgi:hypothetical protein